MKIPLSSVNISEQEVRYVNKALEESWISGVGPYVEKFEREMCRITERSHALAVSNGTCALEALLMAMGIGHGDEVIVPALTFAAPAAAVASLGGTPVFADVTENTWTIDPKEVSARIGAKTKAIIAVDVFGHPCDYGELLRIASGIPIIEDAAEAHGAAYRQKPIGSFGLAGTFSFHANKAVTTGEGGCIVSNSEELIQQCRIYANHGMTREKPYYHEVIGHNFRMTNITAAIGLGQLERWAELTEARRRVAALYDSILKGLPGIHFQEAAPWAQPSCWIYVVGVSAQHRSRLIASLNENGIDSRAIWTALPDLQIYSAGVRGGYPVARKLSRELMWLPTSSVMKTDQVEYVATTFLRQLDKIRNN